MGRATRIAIIIITFTACRGFGEESYNWSSRLRLNSLGRNFIVNACDRLSPSGLLNVAVSPQLETETLSRSTSVRTLFAALRSEDPLPQTFQTSFPSQTVKREYCRPNSSCDCDTFYASINLGLSQTNGRSSGSGVAEVVDVGVFAFGNSGSSNYNQYLLGGAVGKYIPVCLCGKKMRLRAEVEGIDRYDFNFVTNGFPGVVPAAPTPRFYAVHVDDVWTVSGNLWLDIPVADDIDIYTGFGLGASGFDASVTDTFVTGFSRNTEFSYKLGAGIGLKMTRDVVLDFGWRFVDLGQTNVNLSTIAGGAPAGNYELDLHSNEFVVAVRIDLF